MEVPKEIQKLKIALTTDCVLACRHCRVDKKAGLTVGFKAAARGVDMLMASPGELKRLELYGGEPFLKFTLLKDIVGYACELAARTGKKLSVSVASNGLALDEERLEFIKKNRVNLSISVSGSAKTHDLTRVYPDGRGSYGNLKKKLALVLSVLPAEDVVALECVHPARAGALGSDLRRLAALGFKVLNIECVHGLPWDNPSLKAFESALLTFTAWLIGAIKKGEYLAPEPFLEFFRVKGAGARLNCPLYRDLELYPDGVFSFYPFAFIDYPGGKGTVKIGSAASGLRRRYSACAPGGKLCPGCVREYYVLGGLSSGARAYALRTDLLKNSFFEIMRLSRTDKAFNAYVRWLAGLEKRTYVNYGGIK